MVSYFIVASCTFTINFSSKLKSHFQFIFGHDHFPLKVSTFHVSLLQNSTNYLLANGWWNTCFYRYYFSTKKFPISSCNTWFVVRYFSFVKKTVLVVFTDYFFVTLILQYSFLYFCKWFFLITSNMIPCFIFLNNFFLHLDADSTS